MKRPNTTTVILWPEASAVVSSINTLIRESFNFETDPTGIPNELTGANGVRIENGVAGSLTNPTIQRSIWRDPLDEQDIVLITSQNRKSCYRECRDLLNLACPDNVVTFVARTNDQLEAGYRVSLTVAIDRDLKGLNQEIELYQGRSISGPSGILMGAAAEFSQSAYCIVIEYATDSQFVASSATKAAMLTFSRLTEIDVQRGQMSEQAVRMHRHVKHVADQRNREYRQMQSTSERCFGEVGCEEDFFASSKMSEGSDFSNVENIRMAERLFERIGDGNARSIRSRKMKLKSELDRLGLYEQFENRFLDLWVKQSE